MPSLSLAMVEAIVAGAILGSLVDWLFAGILFHDRYQTYPEVWRTGAGEAKRIIVAQALTLLTSAAFIFLAACVGRTTLADAAKLALAIWLIGPLPIFLTNHMFIKIDPRVTASHAIGWLAKLLLIAAAVGLLVGQP